MNVLRNLLGQEFRGKPDPFRIRSQPRRRRAMWVMGSMFIYASMFFKKTAAVRKPPVAPSLFGFRLREVSSVKVCRPHFLEG